MGLLDLFRAGGLRPAWTYSVAGTLWRVIPAPPGTVVGEERDTKSKVATFFALDLASGRVRWSGRRFHDDWWVGVTVVHRNVLLLHGFATPDMPGHRGLVAADVSTGEVLWSDPACTLVELRGEVLLLSRETINGFEREERSLRNGARTSSAPPARGFAGATLEDASREIIIPHVLRYGEEIDPDTERLLRPFSPGESSAWPVEIIVHPRTAVLLTHERVPSSSGPDLLAARLRVVGRSSGSLLYEEVVQRHLHAPVQSTFSVVHDLLLYIKDGRSLRAIPL